LALTRQRKPKEKLFPFCAVFSGENPKVFEGESGTNCQFELKSFKFKRGEINRISTTKELNGFRRKELLTPPATKTQIEANKTVFSLSLSLLFSCLVISYPDSTF
jgi:hypothetical protein